MKSIKNIEREIRIGAKNWLMATQANKQLANKYWEENEKDVIKEYLERRPKIKQEYMAVKRKTMKLRTLIATGAISLGVIAAGSIYTVSKTGKDEINQTDAKEETSIEDTDLENNFIQEKSYDEFFDEIKETKNENDRDKLITDKTKEIIVEAYNIENSEYPITVDDLETYILNESVLQKTDRLGNHTYERIKQNVQYEQTEEQKTVKIGDIYDFRINGQTVAVFDKNGNVLFDKNAENPDMTFQKMIPLLKQSSELKDIYKYKSNDYDKEKVEEEYAKKANELIQSQKENENLISNEER